MSRDIVPAGHVVAGALGLLLGPGWLLAHGGLRTLCGYTYQLAVAGVATSAVVLAAMSFRDLWWLVPVALATQGAALLGPIARRRGGPRWAGRSAHLLGGSYVALVTGVLIARTGNPVFWLLPAVVAQWPIAVAKRRLVLADEIRSAATVGSTP